MPLDIEREGSVVVARWRDGENRLNLDSIAALEALFDEVEATEGPVALVLTGEAKFFSNGLDLDRFAGNPDEFASTADRFHGLLGRLFVLPAYTVAALNGHAFAGGAMLSCGFDHRVMRENRGYWCLNEAEIGLPLTRQMCAAVLGRVPRPSALEAMLTARRYSAYDAVQAGIVEQAAELDHVVEVAVEQAALGASKDRAVIAAHKRLVHAETAKACGWST